MTTVELPGGLPVAFREGTSEDHPFIYATWLKEHQERGDWPGRLGIPRCPLQNVNAAPCGCCKFSHRRYFDEHKHVIGRLLSRAKVTVACNPAKAWQILGYIVHEPGVLHWLHVKALYRWDPAAKEHPRLGTRLMGEAFGAKDPLLNLDDYRIRCTHWTMTADRMAERWGLAYRPFLLEEQ